MSTRTPHIPQHVSDKAAQAVEAIVEPGSREGLRKANLSVVPAVPPSAQGAQPAAASPGPEALPTVDVQLRTPTSVSDVIEYLLAPALKGGHPIQRNYYLDEEHLRMLDELREIFARDNSTLVRAAITALYVEAKHRKAPPGSRR